MGSSREQAVFGPPKSGEYVAVIDDNNNVLEVPAEQAWEYDDAMHFTASNEEGEQ
jgi:hypothetical protein